MAHKLQTAGTQVTRQDDALTIIALAALAGIVASVVSRWLTGAEMPYAGGAAVVVGLGAVACALLKSRAARVAIACVVLDLVIIRAASAALPDLFIRPHGVPSLLDSAGMILLLAAAVSMLVVAWIRR